MPQRKNAVLSVAKRLKRLKAAVKHLGDRWPIALGRHACLREFGTNSELHKLLSPSYAAHVHNMLEEVLLIDLVREIGACILDDDRRTASVSVVLQDLRDAEIVELLKEDYQVGIAPRMLGLEQVDEAERRELEALFAERELERNVAEFERLKASAANIRSLIINSKVAKRIRQVRNKSVAHYDIESHGDDFQVWKIGNVKLTYGEIDEYVADCTKCIDTLSLYVRRSSFDFEGSLKIDRKQIGEYVDALVSGLRGHRLTEKIRRLRLVEDRVSSGRR